MTTTLQKIYAKIFDNGTKKINAKSVRESFALMDEKIGSVSSGFYGSITPSTPTPIEGWQKGFYSAEISGIYPNQNNEEIDLSSGLSLLVYDGENWSKIVAGVDVVPIVERYVSLTDSTTNPPSAFVFSDSYINQVNGKVEVAPGFKASDFIPIPFWVKHINLGYGNYNQFALYDIDKQFLPTSFSEDGILDFDRPEDAFFIRHTSNNGEIEKHQITFSNIKLSRKKALEGIEFSNQTITASDTVLKSGFYISQDSGFEGVNAGFSASDFIDISGAEYILTANFYNQFAFYDANRVFIPISEESTVQGIFKVPNNTKFIRVTIADSQIGDFFFQFFTKKDIQNFAFQSLITKSNYKASDLRLIDGGYINQDNGNVVPLANYSYSDYILIATGFDKIVLNSNNYQQYAFYDINKKYISGGLQTREKIPENAIYLRVTVRNSDKPTFKIRFSSNESTTKTIEVSKSVNGNNAIQNALDTITDASSTNRYQIIVNPDIYKLTNSSQFTGNVPNYPSMIVAKDHVDIIGLSKEDTIISAELPYDDASIDTTINRDRHQTIYNWADDVLFKNLKFQAKYLRYTLHQDDPKEANKTRRYENCDFEYIGDKGSLRALGIGTFSGSKTYITEGKSINHSSAPFAIHNAANQTNPSLWSFENHEFLNYYTGEIMLVQNSGSLVGDKLELNNITFSGNTITYVDWWIYTPNSNDHFNHAEWRIVGSGNKPFYFKNELNGKALRITANTIGHKVRVDKNSTAYASIFGNNKSTFGPLGHPERKIVDGYVVQDFEGGFKSFAIGGLSIREDNYLFGTTTSQDSLGKRLGNCTSVNKTLSVTVGSTTINVLFNQNYTAQSNATIISAINAQLGSSATADEFNIGLDYYPELTDVNIIRANYDFVAIPKGTAVKIKNGLIQIATDENEVAGIAIDDIQPRVMVQGEVKGFGRVVNNCILHKDQVKIASGTSVVEGKRYKAINGQLVENASGSVVAIDNNLLLIK